MTRYKNKKRPLNETALMIRPLMGFPSILATSALEKLKDFADAIGFDYTGKAAGDCMRLLSGQVTLTELELERQGRIAAKDGFIYDNVLHDAVTEWQGWVDAPKPQPYPTLTWGHAEKSSTTDSNGFCAWVGESPDEPTDRQPATSLYGKCHGDLYRRDGRRYIQVDGRVNGEQLFRKVRNGKRVKYLSVEN